MLKTTNAGALVNSAPASTERTVRIRVLKTRGTHIHGVGDCKYGDVVDVTPHDAQYLVGYKFAELVDVH